MPQVVVLAAGEGSRLYPFSTLIPKIMFPIGEEQISVAEFIIRHCKKHGMTDFVFCINEFSGKYIKNNLKDGSILGVTIKYSESKYPLGTAGEIRNAYDKGLITEDFVIYYGDTLSEVDLTEMFKEHKERDAWISLTIHDTAVPVGIVKSELGRLMSIYEKPTIREMFDDSIECGAILPIFYVSDKNICKFMSEHCDLVSQTISLTIPNDKVYVHYYDGEFLDMGSWKSYTKSKDWKT